MHVPFYRISEAGGFRRVYLSYYCQSIDCGFNFPAYYMSDYRTTLDAISC
jgi:hypothetical protein